MNSIALIGLVTVALWLISLFFYFRSSRQQDELHDEIEALNRHLDADGQD